MSKIETWNMNMKHEVWQNIFETFSFRSQNSSIEIIPGKETILEMFRVTSKEKDLLRFAKTSLLIISNKICKKIKRKTKRNKTCAQTAFYLLRIKVELNVDFAQRIFLFCKINFVENFKQKLGVKCFQQSNFVGTRHVTVHH